MQSLRSDENYYGEVGRAYLSNSDIQHLLGNPKLFKKGRELDKALLEGKLFHTAMLEPDRLIEFQVVNASSRNTNIYKDAVGANGGEMLLLDSEYQEMMALTKTMKDNLDFYETIYAQGAKYEEPAVGEIFGLPWKGKADVVTDRVIDLKTTSVQAGQTLADFKWSAKKYNYDSQAYIYRHLFGKPMVFLVIDKPTHNMAMFECSDEFYASGEDKVRRACIQYERFFGKNATENPDNYYLQSIL
jgi:hypothetical protein